PTMIAATIPPAHAVIATTAPIAPTPSLRAFWTCASEEVVAAMSGLLLYRLRGRRVHIGDFLLAVRRVGVDRDGPGPDEERPPDEGEADHDEGEDEDEIEVLREQAARVFLSARTLTAGMRVSSGMSADMTSACTSSALK